VVVVGADQTAISYAAVDHAAIEAELHGWNLRIVHTQHQGGMHGSSADAGSRLLEELIDRVHACSPSVAVTSHLAVGSASSILLAEARGARLLVVGHHHGPAGAVLGLSVADRLAGQHAGVILVVRVPGWPPGPGFGGQPIVVGVEQLGPSTPAVRFALGEARLRGCELVMLRAGRGLAPLRRTETVEEVLVHRRTVEADPVAALTELSHRAAALVVGRRGLGGHPLTMLGSISRAMVQHAGCPVFLI
jgi:nucleotide-binding universal stress UspA family protein